MKYLTKEIKLEALNAVQKTIEKQIALMKEGEDSCPDGMCGPLDNYSYTYTERIEDKLYHWFASQRPSKKQHRRFYKMYLECRENPNNERYNPYWFELSLKGNENRIEFLEYLKTKLR